MRMNGIFGPLMLVLLVAILIYLLIVEPGSATRRGDRPLFVRLLGAITPGALPFRQRKDPFAGRNPIVELAAYVAIGALAFKLLQEGYSFLKNVDWDSLAPQDRQALSGLTADLTRITDNRARLDRAESLLADANRISIEQSALLTSATLEAILKDLTDQHGIVLTAEQSEGAVGLAIALRDRNVISTEHYKQIRHFISEVRNKVMHGDFDSFDGDLAEGGVRLVRELLEG